MKQEFESNFPTYSPNEIYDLIRKRVLDVSIFKQFKSYFEQYELWFMAAEDGHLEVVKFLIDVGIDINGKNNEGYTSLMLAAIFNHLNIVKFLIKGGVNINAKSDDGWTALFYSRYRGLKHNNKIYLNPMEKINKKIENYLEQKMNETRT